MAKGEDIEERLIRFAVRIMKVCDSLPKTLAGKHVSDQLLRSGTSPALNYAEGRSGESKRDFIHKLRIALKELITHSALTIKEYKMTGVERIRAIFDQAKREKRAAFMPYHAMGYPTRAATLEMIATLAEVGADLFEIGIPHSDPLADGPTVQTATYTAITQGTTVKDCLEMVRELRAKGVTQPFCAMTYYNPLFAYGLQRFVQDAVAVGFDGLIVPDLPPEEGEEIEAACRQAGLATIYLLAPTSTEARIHFVTQHTTGFVYLVSVTGITGARSELPPDLKAFAQRVRRHTNLPLAIGFGIGTGEQAAAVGEIVEGVIVGSALVKAAGSAEGVAAVRRLGMELAEGAHRPVK